MILGTLLFVILLLFVEGAHRAHTVIELETSLELWRPVWSLSSRYYIIALFKRSLGQLG